VIRVFLACDDEIFCERLCEYLSEQVDFEVCGKEAIRVEAVRKASELRPDIAILEMDAEDNLEVANAFKRNIPDLPLLLVAEGVSLETEKKALAHGVDAVFPKQDDPTALAMNARAIYHRIGQEGGAHL
jgi:DNA-binding NarL/FixJ family response regulator